MKKIKHIILIIFSVVLVLSSAFIAQKSSPNVYDKTVIFGYPLGFVKQNFNGYDPKNYYQDFSLKRQSAQTEFLLFNFTESFLIVFVFLEFFIYVFEIIDFEGRKIFLNIINKYKNKRI